MNKQDMTIRVPLEVKTSLMWWTREGNRSQGKTYGILQEMQLFSDASLNGWGATLLNAPVQGRWNREESQLPISVLELRAIRLALLDFNSQVLNCAILVRTDNIAAKAYVNNQDGLKSSALQKEAMKVLKWLESHLLNIRAEHIKGTVDIQADWLSKEIMAPSEWSLWRDLFKLIQGTLGSLAVDLFASHTNHQLPRFFTRYFHHKAEAIDAVTSP